MAAIAGFVEDRPWTDKSEALREYTIAEQIEGVVLQRLVAHSDSRGDLTVLLSEQYGTFDPHPPHVYLVTATPKSIRAWVYHERQHDRLACANGNLTIALFDMREDSRTFKKLSVINVGGHNKTLVTIPPYVVHGVYNSGNHDAYFINMPTRSYDPAFPDKSRLKYPNASTPFVFE